MRWSLKSLKTFYCESPGCCILGEPAWERLKRVRGMSMGAGTLKPGVKAVQQGRVGWWFCERSSRAAADGDLDPPQPPAILAAAQNFRMICQILQY